VVFLLFRYASLASILAALSLPLAAALLGESWPVIVFASAAAVSVVVLHRANIARLRSGTENRFRFRRAAQPVAEGGVARSGRAGFELPSQLANRPVPLRDDVVRVDRLEVALAREQEVGVVELRIARQNRLQRDPHRVLDEARLEVGVLDHEQLVRPLQE